MSIKENTVFLSTTNSRYLPITVNLVRTLNQFHPEVKLCLLIVNLTEDEKESLKGHALKYRINRRQRRV